MNDDLIPLTDAVAALRVQLMEAQQQGENEPIRFEVGPVEVEFQVVATREGGVGGKVGFRLFGLGSEAEASASMSKALTQTVKIVLTPKTSEGDSFDISTRRRPPASPPVPPEAG